MSMRAVRSMKDYLTLEFTLQTFQVSSCLKEVMEEGLSFATERSWVYRKASLCDFGGQVVKVPGWQREQALSRLFA
ncbi:MAG: hypothetical protein ACOC58_05065 [Chloroflexota bacterium]